MSTPNCSGWGRFPHKSPSCPSKKLWGSFLRVFRGHVNPRQRLVQPRVEVISTPCKLHECVHSESGSDGTVVVANQARVELEADEPEESGLD